MQLGGKNLHISFFLHTFVLTNLLNIIVYCIMNTEQQILDAAIEEFALKGFNGARTTDIASRAGVTHAMLHYYFRTKQHLFERIINDKLELLIDLIAGALNEPGATIRERLARGVGKHFDFVSQNPYLPHLIISMMTNNPEMTGQIISGISVKIKELVGRFQSEFDRAAEEGKIAKVNVIMLLSDIVSLNIFPFLASKVLIETLIPLDREQFLAAKRAENIETILKRISL